MREGLIEGTRLRPGDFVRRTARRTRQVSRYRHQRVPLDTVQEDSENESSDEAGDEGNDAEKIEVHVHVHRDAEGKNRPKRRAPRTRFKGTLFDWQGHYDRI